MKMSHDIQAQESLNELRENLISYVSYASVELIKIQSHADGGLGRCNEDRAFKKLQDQMTLRKFEGEETLKQRDLLFF